MLNCIRGNLPIQSDLGEGLFAGLLLAIVD